MDSIAVEPKSNTRSAYTSARLSSLVPLVLEITDLSEELSGLQEQMQVPEQKRLCRTKDISRIITDIELLFLRSSWNTMLERREAITRSLINFESPQPTLNEDSKITEKDKELFHFLEKKSFEQDDMSIFGKDESDKPNESVQFEEFENEIAYTEWDDNTMEILLMYCHELRCQIATLQLNKFLKYGPDPIPQSSESLIQAVSAINLNEQ